MEFEQYKNISLVDKEQLTVLMTAIDGILMDAWGGFPRDFLEKHIEQSDSRLIFAKEKGEYIGFCSMSKKCISGVTVHYMEFLVVKRAFQEKGAGSHLSWMMFKHLLISNFFLLLIQPLEIMFITPNIRVLARVARFASFIYPNPYSVEKDGSIRPADNVTWSMAQELIRNSDNPKRRLHREGLILEGSYVETPWLIYDMDNAPSVEDKRVMSFVKKYLGYHTGEDKELVVRARISLSSILHYFHHHSLLTK